MHVRLPRLVVAGLSGDSGKTTVSLSVLSALRARGLTVSVFKKGPDYIDSAWLGAAGGALCRNLDTYMVEPDNVRHRFIQSAAGSDLALIEGNRGIFDGKDIEGSHTTAGLAKLLDAPVVLVVNATKTTRTLAAVINGCISFEPGLTVAGVILNKVAGDRHRKIVTGSIEKYCSVPVLGAVPKLGDDASIIPGRHLGLVTPREFTEGADLFQRLMKVAESYIDIKGVIDIANRASTVKEASGEQAIGPVKRIRIGYFDDSVFSFYYPENLEALRRNGAELVQVSSLNETALPGVDALYIGGGFPETNAGKLVANRSMMRSVRNAAESGMPIYAECGGLIYLSRSLRWKDNTYSMAGVFPVDLVMRPKPAGHGYTLSEVDLPNPFFGVGAMIKGHEFHYSAPVTAERIPDSCMRMRVGVGIGGGRDALLYKSTFACYTHIHADGVPYWSEAFVNAASEYRKAHNGADSAGYDSCGRSSGATSGNESPDNIGKGCQADGMKNVLNRAVIA